MKSKVQIYAILYTLFRWIYLISIVVFPVTFILLLVFQLSIWILLIYLCYVIVLYFIIHLLHTKIYIYVCPSCHQEFSISLWKDISAYNAKVGAKVLICPHCETKEVMESKQKK
ncbi:MAG: hypothetical protein NC182_07380 [Prevotella sp.]|nr:hypothetical protein [Staphylococcus sp.]MCM1351004.1 hypothetical protein [Prevotella sp.]